MKNMRDLISSTKNNSDDYDEKYYENQIQFR